MRGGAVDPARCAPLLLDGPGASVCFPAVAVLVVGFAVAVDEVVALADRIAVMYRGSIVGIVPGDTPRAVLGLMMAGESPAAAGAAA